MAIKRYRATKDNTITDSYDETLSIRGTGSNMGQADILEIFSIYGQATTSSAELSRALIQFDADQIQTDRTNKIIPAEGSVKFFLKMYNAEHSRTLARNFKIAVHGASGSWEEGRGLDMESYKDITRDGIGSNWMARKGDDTTATATWTFTDKPNEETTITLVDYEGTSVTFEVDNNGNGANTSGATAMDPATNNGAGMATILYSSVNASSLKITATNPSSGKIVLTQDSAGDSGNTTITFSNYSNWNSNTSATLPTAFTSGKYYTAWSSQGGDYYTDTNSSFEQTFLEGTEDLNIDVTTLVEQWLTGGSYGDKDNHGFFLKLANIYEASSSMVKSAGSATLSYYTKKFFARSSEFFFEQPVLEAQWDSATRDNKANFHLSSILASAADNLNTIYLYNYVRGKLTNIPAIGTNAIYVSLFSGSSDDTAPSQVPCHMTADGTYVRSQNLLVATGSHVSTGIYKATMTYSGSSTLENIYAVWSAGGADALASAYNTSTQYHTSSIKVNRFESSNINPNGKYVVSMPNLKNSYSDKLTERFRLYVRNKDWSPNIYTKSQSTPETLIIESASYQITRMVDHKIVIPYGTASSNNNYSLLSYDISGNYFDLDMSMLEGGYTYGVQFAFYEDSVSSYRQQPYLFKIRVEKDEY